MSAPRKNKNNNNNAVRHRLRCPSKTIRSLESGTRWSVRCASRRPSDGLLRELGVCWTSGPTQESPRWRILRSPKCIKMWFKYSEMMIQGDNCKMMGGISKKRSNIYSMSTKRGPPQNTWQVMGVCHTVIPVIGCAHKTSVCGTEVRDTTVRDRQDNRMVVTYLRFWRQTSGRLYRYIYIYPIHSGLEYTVYADQARPPPNHHPRLGIEWAWMDYDCLRMLISQRLVLKKGVQHVSIPYACHLQHFYKWHPQGYGAKLPMSISPTSARIKTWRSQPFVIVGESDVRGISLDPGPAEEAKWQSKLQRNMTGKLWLIQTERSGWHGLWGDEFLIKQGWTPTPSNLFLCAQPLT